MAATQDLPVGGQAVLEGVMVRAPAAWAVAIRTEAGAIDVDRHAIGLPAAGARWARLPVLRGIVALGVSLKLGIRALQRSADLQAGARDEPPPTRREWAIAIAGGFGLALGLFFVVPVVLTSLVEEQLGSAVLFWLVEGAVRTAVFVAYLVVISRLGHLRRLFEYHGAEHMAIAAYEAGDPLTPEAAARHPRLHPRCGTSFLLLVMVVSVFVLAPIGLPAWWLLVLTRVLGVPLIAGVSFELIKLTARHRGAWWAKVVLWPGMQLQRLTTRDPDAAQLEVALAALTSVLEVDDPRRATAAERTGLEVAA